MGIFKDSLKVLNEIVTLGGASRLEEAKLAYQETYDTYLLLYKEANGYKTEIDENIKAMGDALTQAKTHLELSEKIIRRSVSGKNGLNVEFGNLTLRKLSMFNSGFNSAINVGAGSLVGGTLAVGSWALVTTLGTATTGTAIAGLSGVAATNATLAWFGGGALAAGGAGMAGGMAVLGGIAAIPLFYFAAKGSHKKAKEAEDAKAMVEESICNIRRQLDELPLVLATVKAKTHEICQLCRALIFDIIKLTKLIRPHGILSVIKQEFLSLIGKNPLNIEQAEALNLLNQSITRFLTEFQISKKQGC